MYMRVMLRGLIPLCCVFLLSSGACAHQRKDLLASEDRLLQRIKSVEADLNHVELDRRAILEELEQLYAAEHDLKSVTVASIKDEIAKRSDELKTIESKRSGWLETLEQLFYALGQTRTLLSKVTD